MKKLLTISLALAMLLMTAACGNNNAPPASSGEDSSYEDMLPPQGGETEGSTDEDLPEVSDPQDDAENNDDANAQKPEEKPESKPQEKPQSKPENKPSSKPENKPASKPENKPAESSKNYSSTLPDLVSAIYAKQSVELNLGDPMAVDLSDADAVQYNLGLSDGSKLKEAYVSESMMGSQAYSLVVVRVKNAADAADVAQSMYDGINQSKWICVTANALAVGAYGDTVMLAMANSDLGADLHTNLRSAYASAVGASKLDVSLDRVDTL